MLIPNISLTDGTIECIIDRCREEFKYKPFVPKRRSKVKMSDSAIFVTRSKTCFLGGEIPFTGKVRRQTAHCLNELYRACTLIDLTGQYGETLGVEFSEFEMEADGCEYFKISGTFMVVCETTPVVICEE